MAMTAPSGMTVERPQHGVSWHLAPQQLMLATMMDATDRIVESGTVPRKVCVPDARSGGAGKQPNAAGVGDSVSEIIRLDADGSECHVAEASAGENPVLLDATNVR